MASKLAKILVPIKRVVSYDVKVRVKSDKSGVETNGVKMAINPFCEIAIEEAVRLKEKGFASEVIAVSVGPTAAQETLRQAMAIGADRSIHVETNQDVQPLGVAKLIRKIADVESPELILLGKQAIDDDSGQVGQLLSGLLRWPQATFASKLEVDLEGRIVRVVREIDGGLETLRLPLPSIVTCDLRLNTPRFAKLQDIMKARKKPIDKKTPEELGVDIAPRFKVVGVEEPPVRQAGVKVKSVDELVTKLKGAGVL